MEELSLPPIDARISKDDGVTKIFDTIRKKYVVLTPEEWVRQHFLHFLIKEYGYPPALTTVEQGLKYHSLQKRTDIVVYNRQARPLLLVECKAPSVRLSQAVMEQAMMYNRSLQAAHIVVTNGKEHGCMFINREEAKVDFLANIPRYEEIAKP